MRRNKDAFVNKKGKSRRRRGTALTFFEFLSFFFKVTFLEQGRRHSNKPGVRTGKKQKKNMIPLHRWMSMFLVSSLTTNLDERHTRLKETVKTSLTTSPDWFRPLLAGARGKHIPKGSSVTDCAPEMLLKTTFSPRRRCCFSSSLPSFPSPSQWQTLFLWSMVLFPITHLWLPFLLLGFYQTPLVSSEVFDDF